ncbi:MAG: hypothetical protein PSX71_13185 [bacterium]|nr:hypothetical protein [bacterium]
MLRPVLASFGLSLALLLSACGGEGNSSSAMGGSSPGSTTVSSNVVKGIIHNGVVRLQRWQGDSYVEVASTLTGADGSFSLNVPDPVPGEVLRLELGLSADAGKPTEMLCDAVACGSAGFGQWAPMTNAPGLASWVSVDAQGGITVMPMTPVSTLLVRYAERAGGGHMDAASLDLARQRIAALFRLSVDDLMVRPGNVVNSVWLNAASPAAVKLSLLAAAFAQLADGSHALETVIQGYSDAFVGNNGHLVQDGAPDSLGDLYRGLSLVVGAAGNPVLQGEVSSWLQNAVASLESGKLSTVCHDNNVCQAFSSDRFLTALGTSPDSLGGDLRRVMLEQNAPSLEQLLTQQLSTFGWVASADSVTVAGIALQSVGYTLLGSLGVAPAPANGLIPTLNAGTRILHIAGVQNGMTVNLDISLPSLFLAMQTTKTFTYGVTGTLENANVIASIDGTLAINATGTDFTPLLLAFVGASQDPNALLNSVSGILKNGKAAFTLNGSASLARKNSDSQLAIQGLGTLLVDMKGGVGGAIAASGSVDHGSLVLPNGSSFSIDKNKNEFLTFGLGQDGTFSAKFTALVLAHAADVTATGSLAQFGTLLTNLRNGVSVQLEAATLNLGAIVTQLLADVSSLHLVLNGEATIPDFQHTYNLALAEGHLSITQPNSTDVAIGLVFSSQGVLAEAGASWWLLGLDLADLAHPAVTLSDNTGGEWRWSFDFSGMLALN